MNGQSIYPIDLLAVFAKTLDCSYDYLMGLSATPRREIQDIKDRTLLTDSAIDSIIKKADLAKTSNEDIKKECANAYLIALDIILESDDLWDMLTLYMFPKYSLGIMTDEVNKVLETEIDAKLLEGTLAFAIVNSLAKSKIKFENKELK